MPLLFLEGILQPILKKMHGASYNCEQCIGVLKKLKGKSFNFNQLLAADIILLENNQ